MTINTNVSFITEENVSNLDNALRFMHTEVYNTNARFEYTISESKKLPDGLFDFLEEATTYTLNCSTKDLNTHSRIMLKIGQICNCSMVINSSFEE